MFQYMKGHTFYPMYAVKSLVRATTKRKKSMIRCRANINDVTQHTISERIIKINFNSKRAKLDIQAQLCVDAISRAHTN